MEIERAMPKASRQERLELERLERASGRVARHDTSLLTPIQRRLVERDLVRFVFRESTTADPTEGVLAITSLGLAVLRGGR